MIISYSSKFDLPPPSLGSTFFFLGFNTSRRIELYHQGKSNSSLIRLLEYHTLYT